MAPHSEYCLIVQPLLFLLFLFSCLQQRPQAAGSYILQRVCGHYHPGSLSSFKVCTFDTVHHSMTDTKWYVQACHGTRPPPSQDLKHSPASPSAHRPSRVTLTWSSGYFGGCVCCPRPSTFHCGRTLRSPSEAFKPSPSCTSALTSNPDLVVGLHWWVRLLFDFPLWTLPLQPLLQGHAIGEVVFPFPLLFPIYHHGRTFSPHTTLHGAGLTPVGCSMGLDVTW